MKSFLNLTVIFAFGLILVSCSEKQQTNTTVYQAQVSPPSEKPAEKVFTKEVNIGPENNPQPLKITWKSVLNNEECWKITDIKVDRNGGDENVIVSATKHNLVSSCSLDMEPVDNKRFDTVLIKTSYKYGLFGSNGENDLFIRGDGKPMVTR